MSATHVSASLRRLVRERAGECCKYCLIPEAMTWALHTIDHIIAEKHGSTTAAENWLWRAHCAIPGRVVI
jgi:hypothetical protein